MPAGRREKYEGNFSCRWIRVSFWAWGGFRISKKPLGRRSRVTTDRLGWRRGKKGSPGSAQNKKEGKKEYPKKGERRGGHQQKTHKVSRRREGQAKA